MSSQAAPDKKVSARALREDAAAAFFVRGLIALLRRMPLEAAGACGDFFGHAAYYCLPGKRKTAYWNIRQALGGSLSGREMRRILRSQFRHLGRSFTEILTFQNLTKEGIDQIIATRDFGRYDQAAEGERGAVLLTAHYGNWELMQIYSGIHGKPIHVLGQDQRHPQLNELLMKQRETHGSVAVSRGMSLRFLIKALKEGGLVGVLADQSAGRSGGILLPFFGRVTTVPNGAFELARRMNAVLLPCFIRRTGGRRHEIMIEEPIPETGSSEAEIIEKQMRAYLSLVEKHIAAQPDQWLWQNKRWKYSWTRHTVVLSDKKPGHFKQSQAVADIFSRIKEYHGRPGLEFKIKTVDVEFLSEAHRKALAVLGWLFLPFIRGRMHLLKFFLTAETAAALEQAQADFIIAAGSSLAPLQHLFAAETGAKKIVLMKPPFPYCFFKYDLAVVPGHDAGWMPKRVFRTLISPSGYSAGDLKSEAAQLEGETSGRFGIAVFVGGATRAYDWTVNDAEQLLAVLEEKGLPDGYVLTTSRRTSAGVERFLSRRLENSQACRKLVIASKDTRPFVAKGMLGLARLAIVTEDSLAMISEAAAAGLPVIVLRSNPAALPEKHRRFLENLVAKKLVLSADPAELKRILAAGWPSAPEEGVRHEIEALTEELRKLL